MANPSDEPRPEWWKLSELAARWSCSPATLARRCVLPPSDMRFLKSMLVGTKQRRVHISEILRHEAGVPPGPQADVAITAQPPAAQVNSLLQKRMDALKSAREEATRNPAAASNRSPRRPRSFGSKRGDLFKRKSP